MRELTNELEEALKDVISVERARIEAERDFLIAILETNSSEAEELSTDLTTKYLTGYLSDLLPILED